MTLQQRVGRALLGCLAVGLVVASSFAAIESLSAATPQVLWKAGFESGDFSEFYDVTTSGCTDRQVVSGPVHTGSRSGALTVCGGDGGVRLRVERFDGAGAKGLPDDAFYSVWVNFGQAWQGDDTNFFQFKKGVQLPDGSVTKRILMGLYARPDGDRFEIRLKSKISDAGVWDEQQRVLADGVYVPANEWVHVELRYVWGTNGSGLIQVWVGGQKVFDISGRTTDPQQLIYKDSEGGGGGVSEWRIGPNGDQRQWDLNHYLNGSSPASTTIHIDDAAVALGPLGNSAAGPTTTTAPPKGVFADDEGNPHEPAIDSIAEKEVTKGCGERRYCPNEPVNRAQMAAFTVRATEGEPTAVSASRFSDVKDDAWYAAYVEQAFTLGIITADDAYRPDEAVSRAEASAFLVRAFGLETQEPQGVFADVPVDSWFAPYAEALHRVGVTKGCATSPLRFCPHDALDRDEMASLITRMLQP